ncbi:MAG TPA: hypothetical protein VFL57_03005 [Bryobacteraceae bacterium]|nr:hypothetical protein [Bryobacteraceae bacterium]
MSQRSYTLIAGVVFLLIAIGHLLRIIFGVSFVVYDVPIPMWASLVAAVLMGFLSYEGFHLASKSWPRA